MKSLSTYITEASKEVTLKSLYNAFKNDMWSLRADDLKEIFGEEKLLPESAWKVEGCSKYLNKPILSIRRENYVNGFKKPAICLTVKDAWSTYGHNIYLTSDLMLSKVFIQDELQKLYDYVKQEYKKIFHK